MGQSALSIIVLAAGAGTRMRSALPKVLHRIGGAPMLQHVLATAAAARPSATVVVTGHGAMEVEAAARRIDAGVQLARQEEPRGTADAVRAAADALAGAAGDTLVLYGDAPLIQAETLMEMQAARAAGADIVVLGFEAADPTGYGRLILGEDGTLSRIVEEREADAETRAVRLCNSGVLIAGTETLFDLIAAVRDDNAKKEFYLTDIIEIGASHGLRTQVVICPEAETLGVNSRADLAVAEAAFQARVRDAMLAAGVTLTAPETVFFAHDTAIGEDAVIGPHVVFGPGVQVARGAEIRAFCHLEHCAIAEGATVGPFARFRGGADIGRDAKIGNFVEIKGSDIGQGAKIGHLSYVGDATVGEEANIGAGTITCNYDGVFKHRTEIGARAFIGSNSALVAPVRVGEEAMTGSGSVITQDVPDGDLAIARGRQSNKPGLARRLMARLRAMKQGKAG
ncbi:MAG: bifunctional UDP-N-acetylglucosamine diphosphorylase/glucosamine-1-phosphate N-acetyltransferase GlmU [Pseudomonadota bacterium]